MVVEKLLKHSMIVILFLVTITSQSAFALTSVNASVDKNPLTIKESIILTVVADDDVNANALDTSALLKNFIVGRTSVSTQTSMVNFKTSRITRWSTVLIARKAGKFIIPALNIENQLTQPIEITVLAANDKNAVKQPDIFITNEISSNNVYVQELLTLTVKLHFSAELKRGGLTEPTLIGANIVQVGKDQESEQIISGKRFRVIERLYAINPQESGEFSLLSPRFSGEIMMPSARRSNFLSFAETKPVSVVGDDIALTVRPIPVDYQGQWLPSEILALHQEWQPDLSQFKVGEPITRTITLTAAGLSKEQLPKFTIDVPRGLKVYPDQAERHSSLTKDRFVSQQVQNFAIVASRAGTYELPAITIPWFNTITNKVEQALIPAQQITVQANTDFPEEISPPTKETSVSNTPSADDVINQTKTTVVYQNSWLVWLFLTLWLLTCLAWLISIMLRRNQQNNSTIEHVHKHHISNSNAYATLTNACKNNNAQRVLIHLLPWVNTLIKEEQSIVSIEDAIQVLKSDSFSQEIKNLQLCLYGKNETNWQGTSLLKLVQNINNQGLQENSGQTLSLNP